MGAAKRKSLDAMPTDEAVAKASIKLSFPMLVAGSRGDTRRLRPKFEIHASYRVRGGSLVDLGGKRVIIFVHGYNVTFEEAALRTAQVAYDIEFKGVPVIYSWPAQGNTLSYTVDQINAAWSRPHLVEFLQLLIEHSPIRNHNHAVEDPFVGVIVETRQTVR